MSSSSESPASSSATQKTGNGNKKKTSSLAKKAMSQFNSSAPSMSVEKFFTDFTEARRNNVDITLDLGVVDRVAAPYMERAKDHTNYKLLDPDSDTVVRSTFALISFTAIRKLLMTIPDSQNYDVAPLLDFLSQDLMAPRAAITAFDNLGKFELDDYVARLKYHSQDVMRLSIELCKVMDGHPRFAGRFEPPIPSWWERSEEHPTFRWADIITEDVVIGSTSSATWIRNKALKYLELAFDHTWEMTTPEGHKFQVSYPKLKYIDNPELQLLNVTNWLEKLDSHMPEITTVVAAGICTAWVKDWFSVIPFKTLVPEFPDWLPFERPRDVLKHAKIQAISFSGSEVVTFLRAIFEHITMNVPVYNDFLNLAVQPVNRFGNESQLLPLSKEAFKDKIDGSYGLHYQSIKRGSTSRVISKIKNKGRVVSGLIFGLSTEVEVRSNYIANVNGDPDQLRLAYLKSDFKSI